MVATVVCQITFASQDSRVCIYRETFKSFAGRWWHTSMVVGEGLLLVGGLGPPITSNTTEFVVEQVQRRRQHHTSLTRSSIADVFRQGGEGEASSLKPGERQHSVGGKEGPTLVPGRHYHCSIQVGPPAQALILIVNLGGKYYFFPVVLVDDGDNRRRGKRCSCHRVLWHRCRRGGGDGDASQGGDPHHRRHQKSGLVWFFHFC